MDAPVQKICCVCGLDVSRTRRTKDPRGNYYCKPCYAMLLEAHQRREMTRAQLEAAAARAAQEPPSPPSPAAQAPENCGHKRTFSFGETLSRAACALTGMRGSANGATDEPPAVVPVKARRVRRPVRRHALRLSDLIGEEAWAECEAARENPRGYEPEIPVSPITNLPVSALLDEYSGTPGEQRGAGDHDAEPSLHAGPFSSIAIPSAPAM